MSYKSPINVEFGDGLSAASIDEGIVRVLCQYHVNVDEKELVKALKYDRDQYRQGEWDMFELVSSAWYGKEMYFQEGGGLVYSRVSRKTMQQDEAVNEFLKMIGE